MSLATPQASRAARSPDPSPMRDAGELGRLGRLTVRLARDDVDVERAQALRYDVFVREGGARTANGTGLETDRFDELCDHLLVLDEASGTLAGTYRLLPQEVAARHDGFYSESEFDLAPMLARHADRRFLELGRSCVHPDYRDRRAIELLWQGAWSYALTRGFDVMFGCASLPGTDPDAHAATLATLRRRALAEPCWHARARPEALELAAFDGPKGAERPINGVAALPPLLKGYLRLGGRVGPAAHVDREFGCIDLLLTLPREAIAPRYLAHYGADARRFG